MGVLGGIVPEGPVPTDRSISKRRWETAVMGWRNALAQIADSVISPPGLLSSHGLDKPDGNLWLSECCTA